jgi:hypothetical protein
MRSELHPNVNSDQPPPTVIWTGASGTKYTLYLFPIGHLFYGVPGVYVFCKAAAEGAWQAIYVGETDNLLRSVAYELAMHHQWRAMIAHGATHICALRIYGGSAERLRIEADLRHSLNPPCNRQ